MYAVVIRKDGCESPRTLEDTTPSIEMIFLPEARSLGQAREIAKRWLIGFRDPNCVHRFSDGHLFSKHGGAYCVQAWLVEIRDNLPVGTWIQEIKDRTLEENERIEYNRLKAKFEGR